MKKAIMKKAFLTVLLGTALVVGSAQAAVVFGNLGASGTSSLNTVTPGGTVTTTQYWGFGFNVSEPNVVLNSVTIGFWVTGGSADTRVDIFNSVSGLPSGSSLYSAVQTLNPITGPDYFTFNLNQNLSAAPYWVVVSQQSGLGTVAGARNLANAGLTEQNASGWSAIGSQPLIRSTNSGSTWTLVSSGVGSAFSVDASPIPEPGTWAAMAIFASCAAYAGWRRRQQQQLA